MLSQVPVLISLEKILYLPGFGLFNAGGIIFMIIGITISKWLADKYGKRDVFGIGLFISTLFILVFYFFPPKSVGLMYVSQILHGLSYGVTIPLLWAMIADVADYSEWKNNRRATAIIFFGNDGWTERWFNYWQFFIDLAVRIIRLYTQQ
jgi:MFS family permease